LCCDREENEGSTFFGIVSGHLQGYNEKVHYHENLKCYKNAPVIILHVGINEGGVVGFCNVNVKKTNTVPC
jgi:hypothetical protein